MKDCYVDSGGLATVLIPFCYFLGEMAWRVEYTLGRLLGHPSSRCALKAMRPWFFSPEHRFYIHKMKQLDQMMLLFLIFNFYDSVIQQEN